MLDPQELAAWIIGILVATPFACVLGTAVYYRLRYRWGINTQINFEKGKP